MPNTIHAFVRFEDERLMAYFHVNSYYGKTVDLENTDFGPSEKLQIVLSRSFNYRMRLGAIGKLEGSQNS